MPSTFIPSALTPLALRSLSLAVSALALAPVARAAYLSNNLAEPFGGLETATATNWLAASFVTDSNNISLGNGNLLMRGSGAAELDFYNEGGFHPGNKLATLSSPSSYSTTLANTTFNAGGFSLTPNTTYWMVLKA